MSVTIRPSVLASTYMARAGQSATRLRGTPAGPSPGRLQAPGSTGQDGPGGSQWEMAAEPWPCF